jgi:hypothetical protein
MPTESPRTELKRDLGTWPAMSIVVATIIGTVIGSSSTVTFTAGLGASLFEKRT